MTVELPGAAAGPTAAIVAVLVAMTAIVGVLVVVMIRRRRTTRGSPPDESYLSRPHPGEIWWAALPLRGRPEAKQSACVVLRTYRRQVDVLKITTNPHDQRSEHLEIPTAHWDKRARRNSFVVLSDAVRIPDADFVRKAGRIDKRSWRRIRRQHITGYVA